MQLKSRLKAVILVKIIQVCIDVPEFGILDERIADHII